MAVVDELILKISGSYQNGQLRYDTLSKLMPLLMLMTPLLMSMSNLSIMMPNMMAITNELILKILFQIPSKMDSLGIIYSS